MIQRVQSLYLLGIALIIGLFFILPVSSYVTNEATATEHFSFNLMGLKNDTNGQIVKYDTPLTVLAFTIILCSLIIIFLYKRREIQLRMTRTLLILSLLLIMLFFSGANRILPYAVAGSNIIYTIYSYLLVLPPVLAFLARRAIKKDDELVKAADRIR